MSKDLNISNTRPGRQTQLYMAIIEYELYCNDYRTTDELRKSIAQCDSYSRDKKSAVSSRTVQLIIKEMRDAYKNVYEITDSIRVSRSGGITKYVLCENARGHLLYPENIFYSKTDRDKLNLLLKVGEYFSLPMETFLQKRKLLKEGAQELFGKSVELRMQPYDSKVFADVFDSIENHQVIAFQYQALTQTQNSSSQNALIVTPYYLKSYANKWYLLGHVRKSPNRWTVFALDRMSDIKICNEIEPYELDTNVIEKFYENVIGFFVPPNPDGSLPKSEDELDIKQISIIMKNERGAFFLEKNPIHKTQHRSSDNRLEFQIKCLDNIHLYQALLRIIDDVRWIEPPIVRNRLLSKLEEAQNLLKTQYFCG